MALTAATLPSAMTIMWITYTTVTSTTLTGIMWMSM